MTLEPLRLGLQPQEKLPGRLIVREPPLEMLRQVRRQARAVAHLPTVVCTA